MPNQRVPQATQGNLVLPKVSTWNLVARIVEWISKIRVAPPLMMSDSADGPILSIVPGSQLPPMVAPTSNASGNGWYNAKTITIATDPSDPTVNLVESAIGTRASSEDCYVANAWEVGRTGHALVFTSALPLIFGVIAVLPPASDGKPCYLINGRQSKLC